MSSEWKRFLFLASETVVINARGSMMQTSTDDFMDFINDALRIIELGEKRGIILRLMGACAVRLHCPKFSYLYEGMERPLTDIDLMTYKKFNPLLRKFFVELGLTPDEGILRYYGHKRHIYYDEKKNRAVDIFLDKLEMCHTIDFRGRLELDYPTITLSDILLEKMQIVKITEKDIKDTIIMLLEHEVGEIEKETVNMRYIARLLSGDWGFYYTVTTNLKKTKEAVGDYEALTEEHRKDVIGKIDKLLDAIERQPKTFRWKMRARIGTSKKWYTEVEEARR